MLVPEPELEDLPRDVILMQALHHDDCRTNRIIETGRHRFPKDARGPLTLRRTFGGFSRVGIVAVRDQNSIAASRIEGMIVGDSQAVGRVRMGDVTNEEWRSIPGLDGLYSVSNLGRVRSEGRTITMSNGVARQVKACILKCSPGGKGRYPRFNAGLGGKSKVYFVHQCVLLAFRGAPPQGQEVRHLNGNPADCALSNLEYGTRSASIAGAKKRGTFPLHERRPGARLNREQAREVAESGETADALAARLGVKPATVQRIRRGGTWGEFTRGHRRDRYIREGETASWSKITAEDALAIFHSRESNSVLSDQYGITKSAIRLIKIGRNWKSVTGAQ